MKPGTWIGGLLCVIVGLGGASLLAQPPAAKSGPTNFPPDETTKAQIQQKIDQLRDRMIQIQTLFPANHRVQRALPDVQIYLKAAEWVVSLNEFPSKDTAAQTLKVLDAGLKRAEQLQNNEAPWYRNVGKPTVFGWISEVDGSVQPVVVTLPQQRPVKRVDVVLHGRDNSLTEVKFLHAAEFAKPKPASGSSTVPSTNPGSKSDVLILEVFGRGNNAYRWAGETDVFEAVRTGLRALGSDAPRDPEIVLRGFSMGGAGVWHLGLHHPHRFAVLGPGAGFTTTRGYIRNLPERLPDYQERTLTIYDAVPVAENVFNVPVVAYSGEKDPQKAAADNILGALRSFERAYSLKHLVAPGLEHKQPPEWLAKLETEYRAALAAPRPRVTRFVTYTLMYPEAGPLLILGLHEHYRRSLLEVQPSQEGPWTIQAENIRAVAFPAPVPALSWNGLAIPAPPHPQETSVLEVGPSGGRWLLEADWLARPARLRGKTVGQCGPIDDAFRGSFWVDPPRRQTSDDPLERSLRAAQERFAREWKRYFRAELPSQPPESPRLAAKSSRVVFGTASDPTVREILPHLPIQWTPETLLVNGVRYDGKTHYPALIYPKPNAAEGYLVLNSGHTFREADLKGTNANLYPRWGDWAVLKIAPTATDPAHSEVVAAGLFDEFWQFAK